MTKKEFLNNVIAADISSEMTLYAQAAIEKLENNNIKRENIPSKTAIENAPIKEAIYNLLNTDPQKQFLASEVAVALDISVNKASALLRQLVTVDGGVLSTEVHIPKKGKQKAYFIGD